MTQFTWRLTFLLVMLSQLLGGPAIVSGQGHHRDRVGSRVGQAVDEYKDSLGLKLSGPSTNAHGNDGAAKPAATDIEKRGRSSDSVVDQAVDEHRRSLGIKLRRPSASGSNPQDDAAEDSGADARPVGSSDDHDEEQRLYTPKEGFVPTAATAIRIARAVWEPIYGEENYARHLPMHARLQNGVWTVTGSLPSGRRKGGVPLAKIRKSDGLVIGVIHGK